MSVNSALLAKGGAGKVLRLTVAWVAGALLLTMMLLTVADVIGRYLFNSPLPGATELTELLLAAVIFLGLPAVCMEDGHVKVDILVDHISAKLAPLLGLAATLLSTLALCLIAWRLWTQGGDIAEYGEITSTLKIPVAPVAYFAAITTGLAALITLAHAIFPNPAHTQQGSDT
jgi:TRAP-type transport system small permease protein